VGAAMGAGGVKRRRGCVFVVVGGRGFSVYQGRLCPGRAWYRHTPQSLLAVNRRSVRASKGAAQLDDDLTAVRICGDLSIAGIQFVEPVLVENPCPDISRRGALDRALRNRQRSYFHVRPELLCAAAGGTHGRRKENAVVIGGGIVWVARDNKFSGARIDYAVAVEIAAGPHTSIG